MYHKFEYKIVVLFFSILLICSCSKEENTTPITGEEMEEEMMEQNEMDTLLGGKNYLNLDSEYIFDQGKLLTFELNLPEASLEFLDDDPAAEEYVEGSLSFEGETIGPVGIRYKGSIGAYVGCLSGTNWANPSGFKTCTKLSMKVKINWEDSDTKFYGLKKLQLHSMNLDESQMRDRLGYWLFREMGVPAPRSVHARLVINGQYVGLFALVEQIDGRFTRYNFDDGKGNLYKEVWPLDSDGNVLSESAFLSGLKTNEDENPSVALIRNFGTEILEANESELKTVINKWMDLDQIMSYIAVDRTIAVDDGAFHWYCNGNDCTNHNYYWYEETDIEKLHLIPWDMDNSFENIIFDSNPVTPIADEWGEITNNCNPFSSGAFGARQKSAVCDKLTKAWVLFDEEYQLKLDQFKDGPLSEARIEEQLNAWTNQIRQATIEADVSHSDAINVSTWENALKNLRRQLDFARSN